MSSSAMIRNGIYERPVRAAPFHPYLPTTYPCEVVHDDTKEAMDEFFAALRRFAVEDAAKLKK